MEVEGETLDLFLGLLAPAGKTRVHLNALSQLARVAYDSTALSKLRTSQSSDDAFRVLEQAVTKERSPISLRLDTDEVLLVVDLKGDSESESALVDLLRRGVPSSPRIASSAVAMAETLGEVLGVPRDHRLLLVSTSSSDASVMQKLVAESGSLLPGCSVRTRLLVKGE